MTLTLNKSIPAIHLNSRTGAPLSEPEATIPFGAIIEYLGPDRDAERYKYMGELYRSKHDVFASAMESGVIPQLDEPEEAVAPAAGMPAAATPRLKFETLASNGGAVKRAKVPGGWLVSMGASCLTFYPDGKHEWDGTSLE